MKVVLSMAISPNGMIARENGEEDWLPAENWQDFLKDAKTYNNFVMGRETYELVTKLYSNYNFDSADAEYKVIVTANPNFETQTGYYRVASPKEAVDFGRSKSFDTLLLIGGGKLNASFLTENLVDEIWVNITPFIIGKGRPFIHPTDLDVGLEKIGLQELSNDRVLIKYRVKK